MSKCILAFLAMAATANAADVTLRTLQYGGVEFQTDGLLVSPSIYVLQRSVLYGDRKAWTTFSIPDSEQTIQAATFKPALGLGTSSDPFSTDIIIGLHDADNPIASWGDVDSGSYYGNLDLSQLATDEWFQRKFTSKRDYHEIPLSPLAIRDINAARGSSWSFGSAIMPDSTAIALSRISYRDGFPEFLLDITYGPAPPLGDFDGTGRADQADLDAVLLRWGLMDQEELDAVLLTWGLDSRATASAIPEPSTMPLAAACVILAAGASWRRRCRH